VLTLTHTLRHHGAHTHTLTPICTPDPNPATPDPAEADMWDHPVSEGEDQESPGREEKMAKQRVRPTEEKKLAREGSEPSQPHAQPAHLPEPAC
jgi:hypothetical protein